MLTSTVRVGWQIDTLPLRAGSSQLGGKRGLLTFQDRKEWKAWRWPRNSHSSPVRQLKPWLWGHNTLTRKFPYYRWRRLSMPYVPVRYTTDAPYNSEVQIRYSMDNAQLFHECKRGLESQLINRREVTASIEATPRKNGWQVTGKGVTGKGIFKVMRLDDHVTIYNKQGLSDVKVDVPGVLGEIEKWTNHRKPG